MGAFGPGTDASIRGNPMAMDQARGERYMAHLSWTEDAVSGGGISERGFAVERKGQIIPGVVWHPAAPSGPRSLVLMGHGGSAHKRNERMVMLGRLYAGNYGWYAAAIDGPVHGARGPVTDANDPAYRQMWQRPEVVQDMIDDWRATLDALSTLRDIDTARVGYWGVSMGTMFGLPYVASDQRVRVAVLGKAGMRGRVRCYSIRGVWGFCLVQCCFK